MVAKLLFLDVRTEWEHTIENMSVLEEVDPDTLVFLQVQTTYFKIFYSQIVCNKILH